MIHDMPFILTQSGWLMNIMNFVWGLRRLWMRSRHWRGKSARPRTSRMKWSYPTWSWNKIWRVVKVTSTPSWVSWRAEYKIWPINSPVQRSRYILEYSILVQYLIPGSELEFIFFHSVVTNSHNSDWVYFTVWHSYEAL